MQRQGEEKTLLHRFAENLDWLLMLSFAFLLATGIMAIYSATLHYGNPGKFFATQLAAVAIGIAGLVFFTSLNYQIFRPPTYIIYGFSSAILMSVLLFGSTVRGTKGWFNLGYFSFQPVEIAKLLFILALAGYLDKHWRDIRRWTKLVAPLALLLGQVGLILMQPDFSSTLVYFPVTLILLYVIGAESLYLLALVFFGAIAVGIPLLATFFKLQPALLTAHPVLKYLVAATHGGLPAVLILAGIVAALFILWWFLRQMRIHVPFVTFAVVAGIIVAGSASSAVVQKSLKDYQRKRLIVFLNPDIDPLGSGYNIIQSKIAIGSGRFLGKGLFSGTQSQLGFLPEQHTDFVFSVIGEETGFFFTELAIMAYFILVWRAMVVAREARDRFGSLVATGIAAMFAFYAVINIGMVMGLMPATGLPLPLLSYGGSNMTSSLWAIGILLSVHIRRFTH
ncbi:MAG: rod shape-determining protein RodA [Elusimicrobia bacterium RIFOXYB2_FULL_50_12]|nr:MAG: rod shape-determining protein RodA [Elusimicrobia bacterium RIFOXYB2_FULL_50_12]